MKNRFLQEITISIILIILLLLLLNPFHFWMPDFMVMTMVLGLLVIFSIFSTLIWKENVKDEREGFHRMMADRIAFISGSLVLIFGIIVESFNHEIDFWLISALGIMILAKTISIIYSRIKY